ncbi:MAG: sulfite exporter TauE/SafE family protein [Kiritimatiellia bacterium]
MTETFVSVISGAVLGFAIGLTGVGGGVLTVPVLILVMGLDPVTAVGTASLYAFLTKLWAGSKHYRQGTVNLRAGGNFLIAGLPGVILSSFVVKWSKVSLSPAGVETLNSVLEYVILGSLVFSLAALTVDYDRVKGLPAFSGQRKGLRIPCTFVVGLIIGATSIGGGILIIPALLLLYGETEKYVGTSIFIALVLVLVMTGIYAFLGSGTDFGAVDLKTALLMAAGSLATAHFGCALSRKIAPRRLQFIVLGVVIAAIAMMAAEKLMKMEGLG